MNYDFLYHISICFLLGFLLGIERQYRRKIAGLRTSILVAIGSFLFVTFTFSVGASDISRIASQIVAGMGFLGAGVILKDGKKIQGLTTAATLWCSAAIGVLCAGGAIFEAVIGTVIILFSNIILVYVNKLIKNLSNNYDLYYEFNLFISSNKNLNNIKEELENIFMNNHIEKTNMTFNKEFIESNISYNFIIKKNNIDIINKIEEILVTNKVKNYSISKISEIKDYEFDD